MRPENTVVCTKHRDAFPLALTNIKAEGGQTFMAQSLKRKENDAGYCFYIAFVTKAYRERVR